MNLPRILEVNLVILSMEKMTLRLNLPILTLTVITHLSNPNPHHHFINSTDPVISLSISCFFSITLLFFA